MDDFNKKPTEIPELDSTTASQLLSNVFIECNVMPNSIPLETLESWGNYKKTEFRPGRVISYTMLVLLILLPLLFFKPTILAQRTNVDATDKAVYEIQVKTLLPVDGVVATLDGSPLKLEKVNAKNFMTSIDKNGILEIKATAKNGQYAVKSYDVTHLDMDKPSLVKSYTEDGKIYLIAKDTYSGIDFAHIEGVDEDGNSTVPLSVDEEENTVVFSIPSKPITISIPDNAGNILQILLSPTQ